MRCISLWQPWASLVVSGAKCFETRSWSTNYRGPLLIHAAQKWNGELENLVKQEPFRTALFAHGYDPLSLPLGWILGRVNLVDCLPIVSANRPPGTHCVGLDDEGIVRVWRPFTFCKVSGHSGEIQLNEHEAAFGDFSPGRYAWLLEDPVMFEEPILYRGRQGLFEVPEAILRTQNGITE